MLLNVRAGALTDLASPKVGREDRRFSNWTARLVVYRSRVQMSYNSSKFRETLGALQTPLYRAGPR